MNYHAGRGAGVCARVFRACKLVQSFSFGQPNSRDELFFSIMFCFLFNLKCDFVLYFVCYIIGALLQYVVKCSSVRPSAHYKYNYKIVCFSFEFSVLQ